MDGEEGDAIVYDISALEIPEGQDIYGLRPPFFFVCACVCALIFFFFFFFLLFCRPHSR